MAASAVRIRAHEPQSNGVLRTSTTVESSTRPSPYLPHHNDLIDNNTDSLTHRLTRVVGMTLTVVVQVLWFAT